MKQQKLIAELEKTRHLVPWPQDTHSFERWVRELREVLAVNLDISTLNWRLTYDRNRCTFVIEIHQTVLVDVGLTETPVLLSVCEGKWTHEIDQVLPLADQIKEIQRRYDAVQGTIHDSKRERSRTRF